MTSPLPEQPGLTPQLTQWLARRAPAPSNRAINKISVEQLRLAASYARIQRTRERIAALDAERLRRGCAHSCALDLLRANGLLREADVTEFHDASPSPLVADTESVGGEPGVPDPDTGTPGPAGGAR